MKATNSSGGPGTGAHSTRFCIQCGEEFRPASDESVLCRRCGGAPEARISTPTRVFAWDQASPVSSLPPQGIATRIYSDLSMVGESAASPPDDGVPAEWKVRDVILDSYEVTGVLGEGGMGIVHRVHHRGWNMDLAVKSPRGGTAQLQSLIAEAEAWIDLGIHPHIVTCYYVRTLGGIPRLFAELVDGGSLKRWIADGKLTSLDKMLDVAIQFAWGLAYAHDRGLVHEDVKPDNVLMSSEGIAKVTDFGLARARAAGAAQAGQGTNVVQVIGRTPEYCSPEQAEWLPLTRRTDVWSWGLSILEMFAGQPFWATTPGATVGQLAPEALQHYIKEGPVDRRLPRMPEDLVALLADCFRREPAQRPSDMSVVAVRLVEAYRRVFGQDYPRPAPSPADLRADSLNNRALSFLDIGRAPDADATWDEALRLDPHHPEATFNRGLQRWRDGQVTDDSLLRQLEEAVRAHPDRWRPRILLGQMHLERGDVEAARSAFEEAAAVAPAPPAEATAALDSARATTGARLMRTIQAGGLRIRGNVRLSNLAVTPDGTRAVVGDPPRMYDLETGACDITFETPPEPIDAHALTADAQALLTIGGGGSSTVGPMLPQSLRVWDVETGRCRRVIRQHGLASRQGLLRTASNGLHAVTAGGEYSVIWIWDLVHGDRTSAAHMEPNEQIAAVAFSPDDRSMICAKQDGTVEVWSMPEGTYVRTFERRHAPGIRAVEVTSDGRFCITGGWDGTIEVWDFVSGKHIRALHGHTEAITALATTPDGHGIVSCSGGTSGFSHDNTIRVWSLDTGCCLRTFEGHEKSPVTAVAVTRDGTRAVSLGEDDTLRVWSLVGIGTTRAPFALCTPRGVVEVSRAAEDAKREVASARGALDSGRPDLAAISLRKARAVPGFERDREIQDLWRQAGLRGGTRTGLLACRCVHVLREPSRSIDAIAPLRGRSGVILMTTISNKAGELSIWDCLTGSCNGRLSVGSDETGNFAFREQITAIEASRNGRLVAIAGMNSSEGREVSTIWVWDLSMGRRVMTLKGHTRRIVSLAFSLDSRHLLSAGHDKSLRIWHLSTGRCTRTMTGHSFIVNAAALCWDGHTAVSADWENVCVWDCEKGRLKRSFPWEWGRQRGCALSLDGRYTAAWHDDGMLVTYLVPRWTSLYEHTASSAPLAVSLDGTLAILRGVGSVPQLFDTRSGSVLRDLPGHTDSVIAAFISEDCHTVVTAAHESVQIWDLDWEYELSEPADWDEGARPFIEAFVARHTSRKGLLSRVVIVDWSEADFQELLIELAHRGYGWLRPDGIREKLDEMARP